MLALVARARHCQRLPRWAVQTVECDEGPELPGTRAGPRLCRYVSHTYTLIYWLTSAVTLYGENEGPLMCSSVTKIVGHLATCYDSSWVYYSIDGCLPPASSSNVPSTKPTATGSSATGNANASAIPEREVHTGVIVGSTVAGVSCVILGLTGALIVLRRRRKTLFQGRKFELSEDQARAESDATAEKKYARELWADHAAVEIGRNSRFEGMMREPRPMRGVNPKIQVYYVPRAGSVDDTIEA